MNKYTYNMRTFYNEDAITYYLLGAFMTDGCVYLAKKNSGTVSLTSKDRDWLEIVNQYICPEKPLQKHGENCFRLQYNSIDLANWLIDHQCTPRKSFTLEMPDVPKEYMLDFIRGCWDGDGSLCFSKSGNHGTSYQRKANITSSSILFTQSISDLLTKLDIKNYIETRNFNNKIIEGRIISNGNTNYRVHISNGENVYKFVKSIYEPHIICMPRKLKIANDIISDWEKDFNCIRCGIILPKSIGRNKKYCPICVQEKDNERKRIAYAQRVSNGA